EKHILFLGDDSVGAYMTLRRGLKMEGAAYFVFKGICNLFWLALLALAASSVWQERKSLPRLRPALVVAMLPLLYFFALHSVFESGSRHHMSAAVGIAMLASLSALGTREQDPEEPLSSPAL